MVRVSRVRATNLFILRKSWVRPLFRAVWIVGFVSIIGWFIWAGYYIYAWTGFGAYTNPSGEVVPGKTLWDWLELIIIPATLALGGVIFSNVQKNRDDKISEARIQEAALQTYLDQMSKLLIEEELNKEPKPEKRQMARIWTLTIVRRVNGERKGIVLRFLFEANLIQADKAIVILSEADLNGTKLGGAELNYMDLRKADLRKADLSKTYLRKADLSYADLSHANLSGSDLMEADLSWSNLSDADLSDTLLSSTGFSGVDLSGANLSDAQIVAAVFGPADLSRTNLSGTHFSDVDLSWVDFSGAQYTESTVWPAGFDPVEAGAILVRSAHHRQQPHEGDC